MAAAGSRLQQGEVEVWGRAVWGAPKATWGRVQRVNKYKSEKREAKEQGANETRATMRSAIKKHTSTRVGEKQKSKCLGEGACED